MTGYHHYKLRPYNDILRLQAENIAITCPYANQNAILAVDLLK